MKNNKLLKVLLIATTVLIVFALIGKKAGWIGQKAGIKVSVETPKLRTLTEIVNASGKIQPETEVKISPDVSGEIVELNIKEGYDVVKGDLLLKIKPDTYLSAVERARATVNSAKANQANNEAFLEQIKAKYKQTENSYQRTKVLWDQETISKAEYEVELSSYEMVKAELSAAKKSIESAMYTVQSAKASFSEAEENLHKTTIYAPMSGTISVLNVEKGERVVGTMQMAGTELLRIANLDRMEVKVDVNENDIVKVKLQDTAQIEIDAYLGEKFKGVVTEIANSANVSGMTTDQVTSFVVKIFVLEESYKQLVTMNNQNPFRPGMSASVDIQTNTKQNVLTIPIQCVTTRADSIEKNDEIVINTDEEIKEVVFVVSNDSAIVHPVKTGIQDNKYIEISEGLKEDDNIINSPYSAISRRLKNGSIVEIVEKDELFNKKE
ncbi:MAG: efflux RND transporter periplasmic adaptor subunit [Bacteroidales bacterium]|jgi:HlyD family secretion protein|nr:efflux RND transporter periplasmic adaptor subunit [Bacteroidales bacterium]